MNIKNISLVLIFLFVVGAALIGFFRTPADAELAVLGEVSQPKDESSSTENSTLAPILDEQGAVTVKITPLNLQNSSETLAFEVVLDTHSVDLSMDLTTLATLTTDTGKVIQPLTWDAPLGGHHVSGTLSFPAETDGIPVLEGVSQITLTLVNVDAPKRVFVWER